MNHYLFDRQGYQKYFTCGHYDIDLIPAEERKDVVFGILMILSSLFFELCYIPVFIILWTPQFQKESCYKLMAVIASIDLIAVLISGTLTGIFSILGIVYCSCPEFMLIVGFIGYAAWLAESNLAVVLAFNRCLFMIFPKMCEKLFKNRRTFFWVWWAIVQSLVVSLLTGPMTYSSIYGVWLFNPHFGYPQPDFQFGNFWHPINNIFVAVAMLSLYILFAITLLKKMMLQEHSQSHSNSQKRVFLQVFIIASLHFVCATTYLYEQYFPIPKVLMRLTEFFWMSVHGAPSVVYLTMNESIRKRALKFIDQKPKLNLIGPSHATTLQSNQPIAIIDKD